MTQNTSSAVMQQRSEPHDSLDDFPTPPWATRALCEWLVARGFSLGDMTCREPAANRGFMVRELEDFFASVAASDVHDYGAGYPHRDYLLGPSDRTDWTITNPPFRLAADFIRTALAFSDVGCAVLVRSAFLEGVGRYGSLFCATPPSDVLQFVERVPMVKGRYDPGASTATSYCWLVWNQRATTQDTRLHWIAPCRKRLEPLCHAESRSDVNVWSVFKWWTKS